MAQELLRVEHLSAAYGGIHALHDISLKVEEGEIVAVLGANVQTISSSGKRNGDRTGRKTDFL